MINYEYIKEHIDEYGTSNIDITGVSNEGIALSIILQGIDDIIDFVEPLGMYFYRLDDPKFGQKYVNETTKYYIYTWLAQILNTGNYEELDEDQILLELNIYMNFDEITSFKPAIKRYKEKLKSDLEKNIPQTVISAESTAISILEVIEQVKSTIV